MLTQVDVGCGTGLWVQEVAIEYSKATVSGVDLSPIQGTLQVPPNAEFYVADVTEGLYFDDGSIDLVQSRCANLSMAERQDFDVRDHGNAMGPICE